jgi:gas vesicle protein
MFFQKKTSFTAFAVTFAIGAAAGAFAALWFAPTTGKEFQRKVADVTEKVIDKVDDVQQTVRRIANA